MNAFNTYNKSIQRKVTKYTKKGYILELIFNLRKRYMYDANSDNKIFLRFSRLDNDFLV